MSAARNSSRWLAWLLSACLGAAVMVYFGYHLAIAFQPDDTNHLETPLALALARQVEEGPRVLYGPYSGTRPLVLIHAPLYYRLAALGAWPLFRSGIDPVVAALAAGRGLSLLSTVGLLVVVFLIARRDGDSTRAGVWSVLLLAAAPVLGSFPVTVRPDVLALCLQTLGAWLVLRVLIAEGERPSSLLLAYICFALAFCTKQHDVVVGVVSSGLLFWQTFRGRLALRWLVAGHLAGLAIVVAYYGGEQLYTGRLIQAAFKIPGALRRVDPGSWHHVGQVFAETAKMSIGLLALALAVLLAGGWKSWRGSLDRLLGLYLIAELAAMVALCLGSQGAWTNYAQQAVVFGAVLVGRAMDRVLCSSTRMHSLIPLAAAALLLVAADARLALISARFRSADRAALAAMFAEPSVAAHSPAEIYFVSAPQHNRQLGRVDLAHDEWLYTAFENLGAAEPRSRWLRQELEHGSVRVVISRKGDAEVAGLAEPLPALGYRAIGRFGRYVVWERKDRSRDDADPAAIAARPE